MARDLGLLDRVSDESLRAQVVEVKRMLAALIGKVRAASHRAQQA